jgi:hypothetical protein
VDRHDDFGPRRDRGSDGSDVDRRGFEIAIHQHRRGAAAPDRLRGGDERVRRQDDLVAWANLESAQDEVQRVGATGDPDAMAGAAIGRERDLELLNRAAKNEITAR